MSQLNRDPKQCVNKRSLLSDLRESTAIAIEQDADIVILRLIQAP
ncbi:DnaB-like helicase C-terminal domain-containing protein [Pseudonocardia sp. ICBG1142]